MRGFLNQTAFEELEELRAYVTLLFRLQEFYPKETLFGKLAEDHDKFVGGLFNYGSRMSIATHTKLIIEVQNINNMLKVRTGQYLVWWRDHLEKRVGYFKATKKMSLGKNKK